MYAPQSAIDPSLAALLQTAQMVTPDQTPTVAAQVAQAAQQKMQPQGIMQGMQGAKQDYAAAQPSMMRNMQQQQVQQMMQQAMQPKPAGIEQLPAQNMQGMQKMAGGGVVGFAGTDEFGSFVPDGQSVAMDELRVAEARRKREEEERKKKFEFLQSAAAPQAAQYQPTQIAPVSSAPGKEEDLFGPLTSTAGQVSQPQGGPQKKPQQPQPQPQRVGPGATPGIAQLAAPTAEEAMATARSGLGLAGTEDLRSVAEEGKRLRAARPASGIQTLEALRKEREMSQQQYEAANKAAERGGIMAFLQGMASGSLGGGGRGYEGFAQSEAGRKKAFAAEEILRASKVDAINDANAAAKIGDHDKYMEARTKIADIDRQIAQIEATYAGNILQSRASVYNTEMTARERAADRAATAALRNLPTMEQQMADRVMKDWLAKNPGKTLADAWDFYRGAGKGLDQRSEATAEANRLKRQKLLADDPIYKLARFEFFQATDPAKKADAQRRMQEIERASGIADEAPVSTQPPPGVKVTRVGP